MSSRPDPIIQTLVDGSQITVDPTKTNDGQIKTLKPERQQELEPLEPELQEYDDDMPGADHI